MTLRDRLYKYLKGRPDQWIASGELQRLVVMHTTYTPRTAVRRLQELCEEGKLEKELRKGHAFYKAKPEINWKEQHDAMVQLWQQTP